MERSELLELAARLDPDEQIGGSESALKHLVTGRGEILIEGNKEGLLVLVSDILRLLARDYFDGVHQDFDVHAPSDEGSVRMTIQRTEARGQQ